MHNEVGVDSRNQSLLFGFESQIISVVKICTRQLLCQIYRMESNEDGYADN